MAQWNPSWQAEVGINHVGAYQVSGQPYAKAAIDCTDATVVEFPYVTRWVRIVNLDSTVLRVGFSQLGVSGSNYFSVQANEETPPLELKVSQLWLYSPGNGNSVCDVVAGLTSIKPDRTSGSIGPSWSGSSGVG
jgi:hypothetical protein